MKLVSTVKASTDIAFNELQKLHYHIIYVSIVMHIIKLTILGNFVHKKNISKALRPTL